MAFFSSFNDIPLHEPPYPEYQAYLTRGMRGRRTRSDIKIMNNCIWYSAIIVKPTRQNGGGKVDGKTRTKEPLILMRRHFGTGLNLHTQ